MAKPVCIKCETFMRVRKVGVALEERIPTGAVNETGDALYGPYKLWAGDLLACPTCGAEVVAAFGMYAIAEHYEEQYARTVAGYAEKGMLYVAYDRPRAHP